jgi:hypothetical protein
MGKTLGSRAIPFEDSQDVSWTDATDEPAPAAELPQA